MVFKWQFFSKKKGIARQLRPPIISLNIIKVSGYEIISSFFLPMGGEILAPILSLCCCHAQFRQGPKVGSGQLKYDGFPVL